MVSLLIAALLVVLGFFTGSVWAHVTTDTPSFTEWHCRPDVVIVVTLLSTAYVAGWRRLRKRNLHTVKKWQLLVYLTSMGMIYLALLSPIDATYGDWATVLGRKIVPYGLGFLWLSFRESEFSMEGLSDSLIDFLKPLMASPRDLPNSGSLLGPKTTRATTKITISSGIPRLPNM